MGLLSELVGMVGDAAQSELRNIERKVRDLQTRYVLLRAAFIMFVGAVGLAITAILLALRPIGWIGALFICAGIALVIGLGMLGLACRHNRGCRM